jgi:uncharacterized protein YbdZ (MbtH family)
MTTGIASNGDAPYAVVINTEGYYSVWPAQRPVPDGWRATGVHGPRSVCLAHIAGVWSDICPDDLRHRPAPAARVRAAASGSRDAGRGGLVQRLCGSLHRATVVLRGDQMDAFRRQLRTGYVVLAIPHTAGGTDLHIRLDDQVMASARRPGPAPKRVVVAGSLTLDGEPLRCVAEIMVSTMSGLARIARSAGTPGIDG